MQAVVFDLYETLVTEFDPNWKPGSSLGDSLGVDPQAFAQAWRATFVQRMSGEIPDFFSALDEIGRLIGCSFDKALVERLYQRRVAEHRRPLLRVRDDIRQMLQDLHAAGLRLGLISNVSSEEVAAWEASPLRPWFDTIVFSYQVGLVKPDRRIYELACARLGVEPKQALFVGDGGSDELSGAAAAGLTPCWATWFLSQWPEWETSPKGRSNADRSIRADRPDQLVGLVTRKGGS